MQRANHKLKAFIPLLIGAATAGFEFLQHAFTPSAMPHAERRSKGRPKRVWTPREDAVKAWQATINPVAGCASGRSSSRGASAKASRLTRAWPNCGAD